MSEISGQGPGAGDECPGDEGAGDREDEQGGSGHDGETRRSHDIRTVRVTNSGCGSSGPQCRDCVRVRAESGVGGPQVFHSGSGSGFSRQPSSDRRIRPTEVRSRVASLPVHVSETSLRPVSLRVGRNSREQRGTGDPSGSRRTAPTMKRASGRATHDRGKCIHESLHSPFTPSRPRNASAGTLARFARGCDFQGSNPGTYSWLTES